MKSNCDSQPLRGNITSSLLELQKLNYLDLNSIDFGGKQIPEFIGSLTQLRFLDLSYANFSGVVPYQLGNLTNLESLNLGDNELYVSKLNWLSHLYKLKYLNLETLNLKEGTDWLQVIIGLPSLIELNLAYSILQTINNPSLSFTNFSTSLTDLDLTATDLSNSAYHWLSKISTNLLALDLTYNQLRGPIPDYAFSNMTSLMYLNLSVNQITEISKSFGDTCSLKTLRLENNNLTGQLPDLLFNLSGCAKISLESLILYDNTLTGSLPDVTEFSSLRELDIYYNRLDGSFPVKFEKPSLLMELNLGSNQLCGSLPDLSVFPLLTNLVLSGNSLKGIITETHMSNLSKVKIMAFSYNSLTLNFSPDWLPPFQLDYIGLRNCKLGPHFPKWLQNQKNYYLLDISGTGVSGTVPTWFWNLSPNCYYFNLSYNNMKGSVPDLSLKSTQHPGIDLSSNSFDGSLPLVSPNLTLLNLSKNNFSGSISCLCAINDRLGYLDLSENQLSGEIPDHCRFWQRFNVLNLANNYFSGRIPTSMDSNCQIISLHLRNNNLSGELPSSLKNCIYLKVIDLGNNKISGTIPAWIGRRLPHLIILSLRSNHISGNLPPQLCNLREVQVLDLSHNNISGALPKCINNFTAMVQTNSSDAIMTYKIFIDIVNENSALLVDYQYEALLVWKGIESEYRNTLGLVKSIDLSSNKFSGKIRDEITERFGLLSLNLSRNSLTGPIPQNIGQLTLMNSLDLSQNQLTGKIPQSFSQTTHLGVLNLSNNNLSGKIRSSTQLQTFTAFAYMGNPELCGLPLPNKCPGEEPAVAHQIPAIIVHESDDYRFVARGFYISLVLGFLVAFWGFCGTLVLHKKWRYTYFQFLNDVEDELYVWIVVKMANLQRHLRSL